MPTYTFRDTNTNEVFDKFMSIAAREQYLTDNSHLETVLGATKIVHERGTNLKVDDGFREVMSKIKQTYKVNNIKSY